MRVPLSIKLFRNTCRTDYERECVEKMLPGFRVFGDSAEVTDDQYSPCDVALIFYSPKAGEAPSTRASRFIRNLHAENLLILEMPLFRETPVWYARLGFDHVHRGGRFSATNVPTNRFAELNIAPKDWKSHGDVIVVASQLPGDYSLDGVDIDEWALDVAQWLSTRYSHPVVVRPHPVSTSEALIEACGRASIQISQLSLEKDIERAWRWVTYTSGSSIDAVLGGVPSVTLSRNNFSWEVSSHSIRDLEKPFTPDRTAWLSRLAYSQWTLDEVASGIAWQHLRKLAAR